MNIKCESWHTEDEGLGFVGGDEGDKYSDELEEYKCKRREKAGSKLSDIRPLNLEEQKQLFLKDPSLNPKFFYAITDLTVEEVEPDLTLLPLSERILQKCKEHRFPQRLNAGPRLSEAETRLQFQQYINELGLSSDITIQFSEKALVRTSVIHSNRTERSRIVVRLPIEYNSSTIRGVLHHQIGTHIVRKFNQRKQIFYRCRKAYSIQPCLQEEEGLACLNQTIDLCTQPDLPPLLYLPALRYYAAAKARTMTFSELYKHLQPFVEDPNERWVEVVRVKRGLTDTKQLKGMYKDQIYLTGAVKILQHREDLDFIAMHAAKVGIEDCHRFMEHGALSLKETVIPSFLRDICFYRQSLDRISKENFIDDCDLL